MAFPRWFASVPTPSLPGEQRYTPMLPYFPSASNITWHVVAIHECLSSESVDELIAVIGRASPGRAAALHVLWLQGPAGTSLPQMIFLRAIAEKSLSLSDPSFFIREMRGWTPDL